MRHRSHLLAMLTALCLVAVACAGNGGTESVADAAADATDTPTDTSEALEEETSDSDADPFDVPVTIVDAEGTEMTFDEPVERIACLRPECLDIVASLGMIPAGAVEPYVEDLAAQPWFFGPDDAAQIQPIAGSVSEPNLEELVLAEPDLIIGYVGNHGGPAGGIRDSLSAIAPTFLYEDTTMDMVFANVTTIGAATGRDDEAAAAISAFEAKLADIAERSPMDRSALMVVGTDTDITTYLDDHLQGALFGAVTPYPWPRPESLEADSSTIKYSIEEILAVDPDVIFMQDFAEGANPLPEQLAGTPLWGELSAVRNGEVYSVPNSQWHTSKQLVMMSRLLDEAMFRLYPEVFDPPADHDGA